MVFTSWYPGSRLKNNPHRKRVLRLSPKVQDFIVTSSRSSSSFSCSFCCRRRPWFSVSFRWLRGRVGGGGGSGGGSVCRRKRSRRGSNIRQSGVCPTLWPRGCTWGTAAQTPPSVGYPSPAHTQRIHYYYKIIFKNKFSFQYMLYPQIRLKEPETCERTHNIHYLFIKKSMNYRFEFAPYPQIRLKTR